MGLSQMKTKSYAIPMFFLLSRLKSNNVGKLLLKLSAIRDHFYAYTKSKKKLPLRVRTTKIAILCRQEDVTAASNRNERFSA